METNNFPSWFQHVFQFVEKSDIASMMKNTVEDSCWHRESSTWVHTVMTLNHYFENIADHRSISQQWITALALLAHDFGKPGSEETKERAGTGEKYHSYAGHESVSANEMISFFCAHDSLREAFFAEGFGWNDLRKIKFMIEHHLPYNLTRPAKRIVLRSAVAYALGEDEVCFYDMLISDCCGRISDDHGTKKAKVHEWVEKFKEIPIAQNDVAKRAPKTKQQPILYVLHGVSGAGKSTFIEQMQGLNVFSEDALRLKYAEEQLDHTDLRYWSSMTTAEKYDAAWKFCHLNKDSDFSQRSKARYHEVLAEMRDAVLDRMNPTRKGRSLYIEAAKALGYRIQSVEFYISKEEAKARQKTRGDKQLPDSRVHQIFMQMETPLVGPEVDAFIII